MKITEAYDNLEKLKREVEEMEPKIKEKQKRIYEVVPILEEKKKGSKANKYAIQEEKQMINFKREEVEIMMNEIQR